MVKVHITPKEAELRVERAVQLFKEGYNCSQSVVGAFADLYGFTQEQALLMSASLEVALVVCDKLVVQLVVCLFWQVYKVVQPLALTVKVKAAIMQWYNNLLNLLSK